ncbi:MAG: hypothetical protein A3C16_01440 [Candidatus Sungbacteria bacterium RIFCSPHIGHO2_02_FULL_51_29]|uniref:Uncharacterized protein n=1 Tax=Candidatus Sungbacteria bacterium RIFCSPHIGHO2_02_FULL_51_29 TaxID=1802273 RepID=A0A1G2KV52_9BACT|nr:MAG: hypothetical protein A3C16_01440 [Candidatus Sungbacteria bacterium RIFCSPHIGHO2_02_FULL_51_29]
MQIRSGVSSRDASVWRCVIDKAIERKNQKKRKLNFCIGVVLPMNGGVYAGDPGRIFLPPYTFVLMIAPHEGCSLCSVFGTEVFHFKEVFLL